MQCFKTSIVFLFATVLGATGHADDWSQWRGNSRDGVWTESGIKAKFKSEELKTAWQQEIGTGYSSPTVADGKVFVMDYSKDGGSETESVRCFELNTGKPLWQHAYPTEYRISYSVGPRAAVTVDGNHAYAMGAMGQLHCLDVNSGDVVWAKDLNSEYEISNSKRMPIWGMACSPIVFEDRLIIQIGAKGAGVIALEKHTGKEYWRALDDRGQYSSPVLVKQNGNDVAVCWTGDGIAGLDPMTGKTYWHHKQLPKRMPIGVASPVIQGNRIFVTSFYDGATMLEMSDADMTVKQVWREVGPNEKVTKAIHSIISTPIWIGDYIYGVDSHGEMRCLKADTGERVWEDLSLVETKRWGTIHFVKNGQQTWMLNEQGELLVGELSPKGAKILSRAKVIAPNQMRSRNRRDGVLWSHPAFANKCVFVRNDEELICIRLPVADIK